MGFLASRICETEMGEQMNRLVVVILSSTALALSALAAIEVGEQAPNFDARASLAGVPFDYSLRDALAEGTVVVYFYPSAYTQGCNIQAHEFSVQMDAFTAAGASVIGVSLDSIERLIDFSADPEYCAGNLAVASDELGVIARSFGLNIRDAREGATDTRGEEIVHGFSERTTFIVTSDGKIAAVVGGVTPFDNVRLSLVAVQGQK
jgi:peroxiredoxin